MTDLQTIAALSPLALLVLCAAPFIGLWIAVRVIRHAWGVKRQPQVQPISVTVAAPEHFVTDAELVSRVESSPTALFPFTEAHQLGKLGYKFIDGNWKKS